jgi:dipeptidyl aminopeptidase/acylaminoacyl peptidase
MTDHQDVRDFLERLATLEPMPPVDPVPLVRRGHRRLVWNITGTALLVVAVAGAVIGGASLLRTSASSTPASPTGATAGPSPAPSAEPSTATDATSGGPGTSALLTGNRVPDAGPFRRDGEVLEYVCCNGGIGAVDPASGETRTLAEPSDLGVAAWSPDGTRLAFEVSCGISVRGANPGTPCTDGSEDAGLYLMNATDEPTLIASYHASGHIYMPFDRHFAWSPDGSEIAFELLGDGLYVADADGSNARRVGPSPDSFLGTPSWAPDGSAITYATDDGVFVVHSTGGGATQVADDGDDAVWSPEGSRIALTRRDGIFVVRPDGTELTRVGHGYEFAWSPSGDRLVYHLETPLDPGFSEQLWVVAADGSNPTEIVDSPCCAGIVDGSLTWAPDGGRVGFLVSHGADKWHVAAADGSQAAVAPQDLDAIDARTAESWLPCLCAMLA